MQALISILNDALNLFYPHLCPGCGSDIIDHKQILCWHCSGQLPHTLYAQYANNPVEKIFRGRLPVCAAHSEFYFSKDSLVQNIVHQIKYKGNSKLGLFLGKLTGSSINNSSRFPDIDCIVPLPLFPEKEKKRGYNQSFIIAKGISEAINSPVITGNVVRKKYTETQTKKHRPDRWKNVEDSFYINAPKNFINKKILLVDDVITTGATLESCGTVILQIEGVSLYIATLAIAIH